MDGPVSIPSDSRSALRARLGTGPWAGAAVAACGCVVVAIVDPTRHMLTPPCPVSQLTGWWCPFCGATRAASKLVRGDVSAAFRYNALLVLLLPVVALLWTAAAFPDRFERLDWIRARTRPIFSTLAVIFGMFFLLRNSPLGEGWLRFPGA